jgi:hypothetical protein
MTEQQYIEIIEQAQEYAEDFVNFVNNYEYGRNDAVEESVSLGKSFQKLKNLLLKHVKE